MKFKTDRPKITTALAYFLDRKGRGFDRRYALRVIPVLKDRKIAFFSLVLKDGNKKKVPFEKMMLIESEPFNDSFIYRGFTPKVGAVRFWKRLIGHRVYLQLPHSLVQDGEDRGIIARFRYSGKADFYLRERIKGTRLKKLYWVNRRAYVFLIPMDQKGEYFPQKVRVKVDQPVSFQVHNRTPIRKKIGKARRNRRKVKVWVHNSFLPQSGEVSMWIFEGLIKTFDAANLYFEASDVIMAINRSYIWRIEYAD